MSRITPVIFHGASAGVHLYIYLASCVRARVCVCACVCVPSVVSQHATRYLDWRAAPIERTIPIFVGGEGVTSLKFLPKNADDDSPCFCSKTHTQCIFFQRHVNKLLSFHLFTLSFAAILRPFTQMKRSRQDLNPCQLTRKYICSLHFVNCQSSSVFLLGKNARRKGRKENRVR